MKEKTIDLNKWKRKNVYNNFIKYTNPSLSVTSRIDVTGIYKWCKNKNKSFYSTFLYIVTKVMNEIEEFRIRIKKGKIVLFDIVNPNYIVLNNNDVIVPVITPWKEDFLYFYDSTRRDIINARENDKAVSFTDYMPLDCIYFSCLPWIDFTEVSNPYNNDDKDISSIPRVIWGKVVSEDEKFKVALSISVNHALIDGEPVSKAYLKIQKYVDDFKLIIEGCGVDEG